MHTLPSEIAHVLRAHTQFACLSFEDSETSRLALLLANGKIMLTFWFIVDDDLDLTMENFSEFRFDFKCLSKQQKKKLLGIFPRLESPTAQRIQYKLNAGKRLKTIILRSAVRSRTQATPYFVKLLESGIRGKRLNSITHRTYGQNMHRSELGQNDSASHRTTAGSGDRKGGA